MRANSRECSFWLKFPLVPQISMTATDLGLTRDERGALSLGAALGPWEVNDHVARGLGLNDLADLKNVIATEDHVHAGGELTRQQWLVLIDTTRTFVSPDDTELQTVTGYFYEDFVRLLTAIEAKVLSLTS